jgi:hypothetical protein
MQDYVIKGYQSGYEQDQVRIGREVARNWVWPYAYNLDDLLKLHGRPDFDPDTRRYCFLKGQMVGYIVSTINPHTEDDVPTASLDFPRLLPGHEAAAGLLMERALTNLKEKGVALVTGRVTSMCSGDIRLAEEVGFTISDWGYKVYYTYEMGWGRLDFPCESVEEMDPEKDMEACANLAALWYGRPADWCRALLAEWHAAGIITHLGVREEGRLVAACMAAPNEVRPTTAAIYYIYTPDVGSLKALLVKVVNKCVDFGVDNVIADLVNEHRQYEPVYQELGFQKVAEWARCEKSLT